MARYERIYSQNYLTGMTLGQLLEAQDSAQQQHNHWKKVRVKWAATRWRLEFEAIKAEIRRRMADANPDD